MSNVDPQKSQEPFKVSSHEIEGLESFGDEAPSAQAPAPEATDEPGAAGPPAAEPMPAAPSPPPPGAAPATRSHPTRGRRRRSFSVFWPTVLMMAGALLLLQNLGYVSGLTWDTVWRLWPLLLIALGLDTLFARRSAVGALFSALLILALLGGAVYLLINAADFPWVSQLLDESGWQSEAVSVPLDGVEQARVLIDWASVPLQLGALDRSSNLIEGSVVYRGRLNFDVSKGRRTTVLLSTTSMGAGWSPGSWNELADGQSRDLRWRLGLSPRVPIDLELDGGSGSAEMDLRGLELDAFQLDVASGAVDLYLPYGAYEARVEGGSGSLDLWLPPEAGVRLEVDDGSGTLRVGERFRLVRGKPDGDGVWESENLSRAESILSIRLDVASGSVRVRDWE